MSTPVLSRLLLGLGLAGLVAASSIALGVSTAFGQSAPSLLGQTPSSAFQQDFRTMCAGRAEPKGTAPFFRTELYFGSNKPDRTVVSPDQFQQFLNAEITPRFPDGLTLLTGLGQFKGSSGVIERERSMELILLYPVDTARSSGQKIEAIRAAYEKQFQQESVLRADEPLPECVSF
jgi:hypothetical protein